MHIQQLWKRMPKCDQFRNGCTARWSPDHHYKVQSGQHPHVWSQLFFEFIAPNWLTFWTATSQVLTIHPYHLFILMLLLLAGSHVFFVKAPWLSCVFEHHYKLLPNWIKSAQQLTETQVNRCRTQGPLAPWKSVQQTLWIPAPRSEKLKPQQDGMEFLARHGKLLIAGETWSRQKKSTIQWLDPP